MSDQPEPVRAGYYRHFKGERYKVFCVATHSETLEELVIYQPVTGEHAGQWRARPLAMFTEQVDRDGYSGPRFTRIQTGGRR